MQERVAALISTVSSPFLVIFAFGLWVIGNYSPSYDVFALWALLFIVLVLGLPAVYIAIGVRQGRITDMHVAIREQRGMPFLLATLGAALLSLAYLFLQTPRALLALAASLVVSGIVFGLITLFWKISIHTASFTGSVTIVSLLISTQLFWLFLLLPVIMWARLVRKRHDIFQALAAAIVVVACIGGTVSFFR